MDELFEGIDSFPIFDTQSLGHDWVISPKVGQEVTFDRLISELTVRHFSTVSILPVRDQRGAFVRVLITTSNN